MTEVPENREMSSPEQFVNRILAIPLISSLLDTTTCYYRMTKARLKPLSGIFHCVEDLTTEVITLTGRYVATPLANRIGGWHNIDSWACQMLDKLESAVPQLKEPTRKIEERVYSKIKGLFDDVCDSDDDSGCIFPDSDESESEAVGEPYDTVCHGKDLLPHNGTDYETGEDEETLFVEGGRGGSPQEELKGHQRRSSNLPSADQRSPGAQPKFSLSHGSSENSDSSEEMMMMNPWWKRVFRKARKSTTRESPDGKPKKVEEAKGPQDREEVEEEMKAEREKSMICECEENSIESDVESKSKMMLEMNGEREEHETEDKEGKSQSDGEERHTPFKTTRKQEKSPLHSSNEKMSNSPTQQDF